MASLRRVWLLLVAGSLLGSTAAAEECRGHAEVVEALRGAEPSVLACLKGVALGPAGWSVTVTPAGQLSATVDTAQESAMSCLVDRMAEVTLPPAPCSTTLRWPNSMDAWPEPGTTSAAAPDLAALFASVTPLGGPSGHCPDPAGGPDGRLHGSSWWPLGFSPEGAFAYAAFSHSDMGGRRWAVGVVSLVDDKLLGSVASSMAEPTPEAFVAAQRPGIEALLAKHDIELAVLPMQPLPWRHEGAELAVHADDIGDPRDHPHHRFRVTATRSGRGAKEIATLSAAKAEPLGVLSSPYEPRAAVVMLVHQVRPEATLDCRIHVVGTHLESGFRP